MTIFAVLYVAFSVLFLWAAHRGYPYVAILMLVNACAALIAMVWTA